MCFYDWPQRQRVSPTTRLQKIFARVKELYSERKTTARLTNLRLSMITDTQKPRKAYPCLEAKAAETKHFLPCLEEVVKESLPEDNPIHHTMLECLKAFNQISQHFDAIAGFPTPSEFAIAQDLANRFFDQYDDLHAWALSKHRKLFHITHKFHTAHHLIRNAQHLSFRMHHNFRAEDFVGQISVVGHSVSFGNAATRVCQKLTQKYLILLHLQLTRPGFGTLAEDDADPWTHWQNGDPCTTSCQKRLASSFTLHFQRKVEHLRWPNWCKKQLNSFAFSIDFGREKRYVFCWFFRWCSDWFSWVPNQ